MTMRQFVDTRLGMNEVQSRKRLEDSRLNNVMEQSSRRQPSKFFNEKAEESGEGKKANGRPQTNHFGGNVRDNDEWMRPSGGEKFNPSKTSTVFRNMGHLLLDDQTGTRQLPSVGNNWQMDQTKNYGTGDTIGMIMKQYRGNNDSMSSPHLAKNFGLNTEKSYMNDMSRPGGGMMDSKMSRGSLTHPGKSLDIDQLITKNEERLKFLDKYKGLESIDEGIERANEKYEFNNELPTLGKGIDQRGNENFGQNLSGYSEIDNLDAIISKYK